MIRLKWAERANAQVNNNPEQLCQPLHLYAPDKIIPPRKLLPIVEIIVLNFLAKFGCALQVIYLEEMPVTTGANSSISVRS